jgi:Cys-tRNA(Pro)/Cys-tRNA(Cys) deacylase
MGTRGTPAIDAVQRAGLTLRVHEYAHEPRATLPAGGRAYASEAADALGITPDRVLKTTVVDVDRRPGLAIVPADAEVDLKAVADAVRGRRAVLAAAADAEKATGYVIGGISPLGTRWALPSVLDDSAAGHATIHVSAGRRGLEIELAASDLQRLTGAVVAPVARRP